MTRSLTITALLILMLSAFCYRDKPFHMPLLSCTLSSNGTTYKLGEVPKLEVRIKNNSNKDIYLIGALDLSDSKRRMPYCYYEIEKPAPDTVFFSRCGTANPLRAEEFKMVKANGVFDPYEHIDDMGFWPDHTIAQKETFRNAGVYKIQFHYSIHPEEFPKFVGSISLENWAKKTDTLRIKQFFTKVPKVDLVSNTIEIRIEK